jgi:hypothetical protein
VREHVTRRGAIGRALGALGAVLCVRDLAYAHHELVDEQSTRRFYEAAVAM